MSSTGSAGRETAEAWWGRNWRFNVLQVAVAGRSERIDLLAKDRRACN